jgi:hypothetical protein
MPRSATEALIGWSAWRMVRDGATRETSVNSLTPALSSCRAVTTETARGTFWTFSARFWAVTTTSSSAMASGAAWAKADVDIANRSTGVDAQQSSRFMDFPLLVMFRLV